MAQGDGEAGARKTAANNDQIDLLHGSVRTFLGVTRQRSGRIAGRLVRALPAVVVAARAVLLGLPRSGRFLLLPATTDGAAGGLGRRDPVTRGKLDFKFDDFIPLLICPVTLGNRQEFAQAAPIIGRRRRGRGTDGRIFWVLTVHRKLKSGVRWQRTPHLMVPVISSSRQASWLQRQP
jgi:hypothetical protein